MTLTQGIPIFSFVLLVGFAILRTREDSSLSFDWRLPALLGTVLFGLSLYAIVTEGLLGFWANHAFNFWGSQVWVDLIMASALSWYFLASEAKRLRMNLVPWLILFLLSGSVGLYAMLSRILYLKKQAHGPTA